jgi:Uma2 family endonuclease
MSVEIARHCFTVAEYNRMAETGILSEDDRVELLEGEIVEMSPIGSRHAACVDRMTKLFIMSIAAENYTVRVQSPLQLDDYSEPQPDLSLLKPRADFYEQAHPTPADTLLVVEVSDTTVEYDRQVKLPLYARAGIPEVWLINLPAEQIEIYAQPAADNFQHIGNARRGEQVRAQGLPKLNLSVAAILG